LGEGVASVTIMNDPDALLVESALTGRFVKVVCTRMCMRTTRHMFGKQHMNPLFHAHAGRPYAKTIHWCKPNQYIQWPATPLCTHV
jgi:hypothetical protein